jgi:Uma2 family endonuclease
MVNFMLDPALVEPDRVLPRRRMSRRTYDRLVERGAFDDERIELLRGRLVTMSPQGVPHSTMTARLAERLIRAVDESYDVRVHSPYAASDDSEPEPDISVSRRRRAARQHPSKALLLIEVAESSLRKDRLVKAAIYAENRAPEYWIIDLASRSVFVHTEPSRGVFRSVVQLRRKEVLRPLRVPGIALTVAELFRAMR